MMSDDEESFEYLCLAIASSALDASSPHVRQALLNDTIESVCDDAEARKSLSSKFGVDTGKQY